VAQAIGLLLDIFGLASLVALLASLAITAACRRGARFAAQLRESPPLRGAKADSIGLAWTGHFILPISVAIAYFLGYATLPRSWAALIPQENQSWQWLPYLGLTAAIFAASFPHSPRWSAWKFTVVAVAPIAGAALAPTWPIFGLGQQSLRVVVALYLLAVGLPLQHLPSRLVGNAFAALLCTTAIAIALASGMMVSTRLAQLAAIAAAALAGSWIGFQFGRRPIESSFRSLIPVFAVLIGGVAWSACVEPDPPLAWVLILPLLPLLIWLTVILRRPQLPFAT
jgi:hypothetical protein